MTLDIHLFGPSTNLALEALERYDLDEDKSLKKIARLFSDFARSMKEDALPESDNTLPPVTRLRLSYFADKITEYLDRDKETNPITNLHILFIQMKQFLQTEAICMGLLRGIMESRLSIDLDDRFSDARKNFGYIPYFLRNIDPRDPKIRTKIPIKREGGFEPILAKLGVDISAQTNEFDCIMMKLVEGYGFHNKIYTIVDRESKIVTEKYLNHPNILIRSTAQFLYKVHISAEYTNKHPTLTKHACYLIAVMTLTESHTGAYERFPFTPFYVMLGKEVDRCRESGESFDTTIFFPKFTSAIIQASGINWREELKYIFEITNRLGNVTKQIFSKLTFKPKGKEAIDRIITLSTDRTCLEQVIVRRINEDLIKSKSPPINVTLLYPLCNDISEFEKLTLPSDIFKKCHDIENKKEELEKRRKTPKTKKPPSKHLTDEPFAEPPAGGAGGAGGAAGAGGAGASAFHSELDEACTASTTLEAFPEKDKPSLIPLLDLAVARFSELRFHERVASFQRSIEEGLAHRLAHESSEMFLSREEMAFRHRLPTNIFILLFHPSYSRKSYWTSPRGKLHEHRDLVIKTSTKGKYILGATISNDDEIYHLYLRPVLQLQDYSIAVHSGSEFPPLSRSRSSKSLPPISIEGIVFDSSTGDATVSFEDIDYTILNLNAAL